MKNKILVDVDEVIKLCIEDEEKFKWEPSFTFIDIINELYGLEQKVFSEVVKQIGEPY